MTWRSLYTLIEFLIASLAVISSRHLLYFKKQSIAELQTILKLDLNMKNTIKNLQQPGCTKCYKHFAHPNNYISNYSIKNKLQQPKIGCYTTASEMQNSESPRKSNKTFFNIVFYININVQCPNGQIFIVKLQKKTFFLQQPILHQCRNIFCTVFSSYNQFLFKKAFVKNFSNGFDRRRF